MTTTQHPLTETAAAELWDESPRRGKYTFMGMLAAEQHATVDAMRAAFDAGREHEREHADPHHDPRPWQDCTREDVCEGDLVERPVGDRLGVGVAHHQDKHGDWYTQGGYQLTNSTAWPLRRIPAPTPDAEEVELPGVPCALTDVRLREALAAGVALWTGSEVVVVGFAGRAVVMRVRELVAFTLPDGTRARRDGDHADGRPRFVKKGEDA